MTIRLLCAVCCLLAACKYGGSSEDPTLERAPTSSAADAMVDARSSTDDDDEDQNGDAPPPATGNETPPRRDGSSEADGDAAGRDDGSVSDASSVSDAGAVVNECAAPTPVVGCDPVRNTGCPALTFCDIEPAPADATGRCVFPMDALGGPCSASTVSSTCPPQSTCVAEQCRKLCYCDSECPVGECCTDTSAPGPAGFFKLCRPC